MVVLKSTLLAEHFVENGDFRATGTNTPDSSIFAATFTESYTIKNLTLKPKFRVDTASDEAFIDKGLEPLSFSSDLQFLN
ncbi:MAG: hypothetical protein KAH07_08055 [Flavobacteriaceae bacterium]|nr:hypothetical protein [Flavobacteriaceae bacterium]